MQRVMTPTNVDVKIFANIPSNTPTRKHKCQIFFCILILILFLRFSILSFTEPIYTQQFLSFFVVGDWGIPTPARDSVFQTMKKLKPELRSQFVVDVGDHFYKHGVTSRYDERFKTEFEDIIGDALGPWYLCFGNHDVRNSMIAQIEYSKLNPIWNFPERYYTIEKSIQQDHNVLFIFLDTNTILCDLPDGIKYTHLEEYECKEAFYSGREKYFGSREKHLKWLKNELKKGQMRDDIKAIFIVGHHPLWSVGPHGDPTHFRENLLPIILQYSKIKIYFCGHNHGLEHYVATSGDHTFHQILSGGGGYNLHEFPDRDIFEDGEWKAVKQIFNKGTHGFANVKIIRSGIDVTFYDYSGVLVHKHKIPLFEDES